MKRLVSVVGNAVLAEGDAERIDASDIVIRFNEPPEGPARIGTRTDLLFVMNSGNSMQARLDGRGYTDSAVFRTARKIILPYHPAIIARYHPKPNILSRLKGRRADWTAKAIAVFGREGVRYALAKFPADCAAIRLYGFGWEGWKRHAWDAERDWITRHLPPG
jgi:hypothetical protein